MTINYNYNYKYNYNYNYNYNYLQFQMTYLYPNIPKHQAFGKYYSQITESIAQRNPRNGYVPHHLVNVIQGYWIKTINILKLETVLELKLVNTFFKSDS